MEYRSKYIKGNAITKYYCQKGIVVVFVVEIST